MFLASVNMFVDAGICWLSFSMCSASIRVSRILGYGTWTLLGRIVTLARLLLGVDPLVEFSPVAI